MGDLEGPVADVSCGPGHVLQMLKDPTRFRVGSSRSSSSSRNDSNSGSNSNSKSNHTRNCNN